MFEVDVRRADATLRQDADGGGEQAGGAAQVAFMPGQCRRRRQQGGEIRQAIAASDDVQRQSWLGLG